MPSYQKQLRIIFSLALLSAALLEASRSTTIVQAQAGGCGNAGISFKVVRESALQRGPRVFASGDFNQDGVPDLAVVTSTDSGAARVAIMLGDGQGAFAKLTEMPTDGLATDLLARDLNGDGKLDLALAGVVAQQRLPMQPLLGGAIALGNGDGTFGALKSYVTGEQGITLVAADFTGDSKLDLAVADRTGHRLLVLPGMGDGTFGTPDSYRTGATNGPTPASIVTADFNRDGKPDVALGNSNENTISVFLNDGSGKFGTPTNIPGRDTRALTVGDFDGDGIADLIVGGSSSIFTLRGDGAGGFGTASETFLNVFGVFGVNSTRLIARDLNGDGKAEIIFPNGSGIVVLQLNAAGSFFPAVYGAGKAPAAVAALDANRDDKLDLVATSPEANRISVLLNSGANDFRAMKIARISTSVQGVNFADLNNDSKPDLIVHEPTSIYTGFGNGAGEFSEVKSYGNSHKINSSISASVIADFTGDGNADLAVLNPDSTDYTRGAVTLLPDVGVPVTNPALYSSRIKTFKAGLRSVDLVAADFNRDNRPDLAVANSASDDVTILLNDGRGGFVTAATIGVGLDPRSIVAGDFNSDDKMDLAVACRNTAGVFILLGDGQGNFSVTGVGIGANPRLVITGDFNRDGKLDLAVPHNNSNFVSILLGTGQGTFNAPLTTDVGGRPFTLAVGDFNGDSKPDFAVTRYIQSSSEVIYEDRVWLFAGDGTGNFTRASNWFAPSATHLRAADFNNDGLTDLAMAAASGNGGSVWIAFNVCNSLSAPNTVVTVNAASYAGVSVSPEAIVSAFGTDLSNDTINAPSIPLPTKLGDTQVVLKDSKGVERLAPLFFVSPLQVNYQIPAGTANGIATITISNGAVKTSTGTVLVIPTAPGLFAANANGEGVAAAKAFRIKYLTNAESYEEVAQYDPVLKKFVTRQLDIGPGLFPINDKVYLLLFGTGIRSRAALENVRVRIGNTDVPVEYAGPQPEFVGLDQVNVLISNFRGIGEVDVVLTVDSKISNAVRINIK